MIISSDIVRCSSSSNRNALAHRQLPRLCSTRRKSLLPSVSFVDDSEVPILLLQLQYLERNLYHLRHHLSVSYVLKVDVPMFFSSPRLALNIAKQGNRNACCQIKRLSSTFVDVADDSRRAQDSNHKPYKPLALEVPHQVRCKRICTSLSPSLGHGIKNTLQFQTRPRCRYLHPNQRKSPLRHVFRLQLHRDLRLHHHTRRPPHPP